MCGLRMPNPRVRIPARPQAAAPVCRLSALVDLSASKKNVKFWLAYNLMGVSGVWHREQTFIDLMSDPDQSSTQDPEFLGVQNR